MFLKAIPKKDKTTGQTYTYYRLCESYRLENKIRHRHILNLGRVEELTTDIERKQLADRIEQLYKGTTSLFAVDEKIGQLAQQYAARLKQQKALAMPVAFNGKTHTDKPPATEQYDTINLSSIKHEDVREIGAEWLCKQAATQLKITETLQENGFTGKQTQLAVTQIISRAVYPASELKTESNGYRKTRRYPYCSQWNLPASAALSFINQP